MAARLELWEPCLECASRKIEEMKTICYDVFGNSVPDYFDSCIHALVCKRIDGLEILGNERDAS